MLMQDVKNITITEGEVRNIYNDGVILWGRLGFDTTYQGNCMQPSYSGKNLWGSITQYYRNTSGIDFTSYADGTITASGTASANAYSVTSSGALGVGVYINLPAGTYTLSEQNNRGVQVIEAKSGGNILADTGTADVTFILTEAEDIAVRAYITNGTAITGTITFYPMLERGNTPSSYEPYVGGIPSPNASYPQPISVVTGEQTITIVDGTTETNYPLSLGTLELCAIDGYQDKIYKNGDNWYIHKEIGKVTFTGAETWTANADRFFYTEVADALISPSDNDVSPIFCNYYVANSPSRIYNKTADYGISDDTTYNRIRIRNKDISSAADFQTWLLTHNTIVYYALDTATNTLIEDETLIEQLNYLNNWLTREGYNYTIDGNLPIIITQDPI